MTNGEGLASMHSRWLQDPYRETFPLSHLMRTAIPHAWLRIHSLPDSKRYASNDLERQVVFERYRRFGSALLGDAAPCAVIHSRFDESMPEAEWLPKLEWVLLKQTVENQEEVWNSWIADATWNPDTFRPLLMAIADDQVRSFAFLSKTTDAILAPYDGGADGFSLDAPTMLRLSKEFQSWRSAHPRGL